MKIFYCFGLFLTAAILSYAQPGASNRKAPAVTPVRATHAIDGPQTVKRQVGTAVYDLSKLFSAQIVPNGTNTPWAQVTGKFERVQLSSHGWVITGTVNKTSQTFVLRNPPQQAMDEFKKLQSQRKELLDEFKDMTGHDYADLAKHPELLDSLSAIPDSATDSPNNPPPDPRRGARHQRRMPPPPGPYQNQSDTGGGPRHDPQNWLANPAARQLAQDIHNFDSKGYDLDADFSIRCYAIKTTEKLDKLPVYDRGRVVR